MVGRLVRTILFLLISTLLAKSFFHSSRAKENYSGRLMMQEPRRIGIFWDVDGTLSDSFMLGFESTQTVLKNNGMIIIYNLKSIISLATI